MEDPFKKALEELKKPTEYKNPFVSDKKEDKKEEYKKLIAPLVAKSKVEHKKEEPVKQEQKPISSRKAEILKQHNNIESDIPVNSAYWRMRH